MADVQVTTCWQTKKKRHIRQRLLMGREKAERITHKLEKGKKNVDCLRRNRRDREEGEGELQKGQ